MQERSQARQAKEPALESPLFFDVLVRLWTAPAAADAKAAPSHHPTSPGLVASSQSGAGRGARGASRSIPPARARQRRGDCTAPCERLTEWWRLNGHTTGQREGHQVSSAAVCHDAVRHDAPAAKSGKPARSQPPLRNGLARLHTRRLSRLGLAQCPHLHVEGRMA